MSGLSHPPQEAEVRAGARQETQYTSRRGFRRELDERLVFILVLGLWKRLLVCGNPARAEFRIAIPMRCTIPWRVDAVVSVGSTHAAAGAVLKGHTFRRPVVHRLAAV